MHALYKTVATAAAVAALAAGAGAISKVSRDGRYLYTADGDRFYIKGVAYQEQGEVTTTTNNPFLEPSTFIDPLANSTACSRDLPYLEQLGVNTIRVYSVNSSLDHDDCMNALSGANIYTIIDLTLPVNGSINRDDPTWTTALLDQYIDTIDAFNKYDNVLAYNVGNEVVIAPNASAAAAYVKAAARDTKAYLASISSSALVGYAAIDGASDWRDPLANYLSCDPSNTNSGSTAIDIYGVNNYEWCGDASASVYDTINGDFAGYNIPAYFSEFGCVTAPPRLWTEVAALLSSPMTEIWSGGVAFSYFPAASSAGQFGMITLAPNGSVETSSDFTRLAAQYAQADPPQSPAESAAGTTRYPACPAQNSTFLASTTLPPTPDAAACGCIEGALSCVFTPHSSNTSAVVGVLIGDACGYLAQQGGSCAAISGNGTTGVYGRVSYCDPEIQLSFVMSEYYEATGENAQACNFAGNATVNSAASQSATAVATSCDANPSATFTPSAPASASGAASTSGSTTNKSGAPPALGSPQALLGVALACLCSVAGGLLTLA